MKVDVCINRSVWVCINRLCVYGCSGPRGGVNGVRGCCRGCAVLGVWVLLRV